MSSSINYTDYSDRSFCVRADRDRFGRNLKNLNGKWHSNIDGSPGWLVPKVAERELRQLVKNSEEIDRMTTTPQRKDPRYHRADSDDEVEKDVAEDGEDDVYDDDLDPIVKSLLDGNRKILNENVQDSAVTTASRASRVSNMSRASKVQKEPVERIRRPSPKKERGGDRQTRDMSEYTRYGESTREYRKRFGQRPDPHYEEEDEEQDPVRKKKYYSSSEEEESEDDFPMPNTPKEDPRIGQIDAIADELSNLSRRVRRLEKQIVRKL